jgi:putative addiction module component (TIGR02574 family)
MVGKFPGAMPVKDRSLWFLVRRESLGLGAIHRNAHFGHVSVVPDHGDRIDMNPNSIFDLSPPEKLQLVEDLWDDLAATPSEVPIHDWQKQELARRKANLMSKPASGLSWDAVKARIRSRYGR